MLSTVASARIQRWVIYLGAHSYTIEHNPAKDHSNVDGLSCLSNPITGEEEDLVKVVNVAQVKTIPNRRDISKETQNDPVLKRVLHYTQNEWKEVTEEEETELASYYHWHNEMFAYKGVLMWCISIVFPPR